MLFRDAGREHFGNASAAEKALHPRRSPPDFVRSLLRSLLSSHGQQSQKSIKHLANKYPGMSGPGAGFEYTPQEVSWLKRYASSIRRSMGGVANNCKRCLVICNQHRMHSRRASLPLCMFRQVSARSSAYKFRNFIPISKPSPLTQSFYVRYHSFRGEGKALTSLLAFKHTDQEVIDFYARSAGTPIPNVPRFDNRRLVDGQRSMSFLKPLPPTSAGKKFELRSKVLGVYDKGKAGTVIETETVLAEKGGDIYTKAVGSAFYVGQGNWGGPKGED